MTFAVRQTPYFAFFSESVAVDWTLPSRQYKTELDTICRVFSIRPSLIHLPNCHYKTQLTDITEITFVESSLYETGVG